MVRGFHVALMASWIFEVVPQDAASPATEVFASFARDSVNMKDNLLDGHIVKRDDEEAVPCEEGKSSPPLNADEIDECGVWFARSTIPGAGMGMFAGRSFDAGQQLLPTGDIVVPIVDVNIHHDSEGKDFNFLWDEYTWDGETLLMDHEGYDIHGASPGFGAAANCFLDLVNVKEHNPTRQAGSAGLHRSIDPGAGAFTIYHDRITTATMSIQAGEEFFVDYGSEWFRTREEQMGKIPLHGHHRIANNIVKKYNTIEQKYNGTLPHLIASLRDKFLVNNRVDSNILNALPRTHEELDIAKDVGLLELRRQQSTVPVNWLQEHGTCADNIRAGPSNLPQAGRGAFATRFLPKDAVVAPAPMIHLVDGKRYMEMYELIQDDHDEDNYVVKDCTNVVGKQLLLNYCYGHPDSTLLLCPYGSMTSLINHNRTRANVRLQWADPKRSNHQPEWLNKTIEDLSNKFSTVVAMEFVATRNILPGEEILMDYGETWEDAWNQHVAAWTPPLGSAEFRSSLEMNEEKSEILRTEFDQIENPYPKNLELMCNSALRTSSWQKYTQQGTNPQSFINDVHSNKVIECDLLQWERDGDKIVYTALLTEEEPPKKMVQVPREAFVFVDKPYTSDMHLPKSFRQEIAIPDHLFPEQWKNVYGE